MGCWSQRVNVVTSIMVPIWFTGLFLDELLIQLAVFGGVCYLVGFIAVI